MSTIAITKDNFAEHIQKPGIVVIDFWASWCGPCRMFAPIFEAASQRHPDITWGKVDTEAEPELAGALDIHAIPTLMVFRDNVLLFAQPGLVPAKALDEIVDKVRALDMVEVMKKGKLAEASP
jgi:thioredoxin 1